MTSQATSEAKEEEIRQLDLERKHSIHTVFAKMFQKKELITSTTEKIKLLAVHDFNPRQTNLREKKELRIIFEKLKMSEHDCVENEEEFENTECLNEFGHASQSREDKQLNGKDELRALRVKVYSRREETSDNEDQKEAIKIEELKTVTRQKELTTDQKELHHTSHSDDRSDAEEMDPRSVESEYESEMESDWEADWESEGEPGWEADWESVSCHSDESDVAREKDPCALVLTFKRGDQMEAFSQETIGDADGWWMVRHLDSGKIGFIPRNRVVMETDHQPSNTTLFNLPLELLDIVLEKSFLHWILSSTPRPRDEYVVSSLASVDFCWFQRITGRRFKKRIWQRLKDIYKNTQKTPAIIRISQNYLLETIQPNDEFIGSLLSFNCITEEQSHFIQRRRSKRYKNDELLNFLRSFDETKFSNVVKCLRQTNQKTVARIMEQGGGVIKVEIQNRDSKCITSMDTKTLHQTIEDFRNRTKPWSRETDKLISELKEDGIEILKSQLDRKTVAIWIWYHSQAALKNIQKKYESNQLKDVFLGFGNIRPSTSEITQSTVINIDRSHFKKTVVECPLSITFNDGICVEEYKNVKGLTKLRDEIYIFCETTSSSHVLCVFEDRKPFNLQRKIKIENVVKCACFGRSEKENSIFVIESEEKFIWKITRKADGKYRITKLLTPGHEPMSLSVSSNGQLLVISESSSILKIYGSDATFIRSIQLPTEIENPWYAVETSIGNFIIVHQWNGFEEEEESESTGEDRATKTVASEVTTDGQIVIRRFIPSKETQINNDPFLVFLDSDDRVFIADFQSGGVILLDSDLKWNLILSADKSEDSAPLYYDEEKKQLIVEGLKEVYVYTLSRA